MLNISQIKMDSILNIYRKLISAEKTEFKRYLHSNIDWNERMTCVMGARGTGKTTLVLQHIRDNFPDKNKAIYVSLDNLWFTKRTLVDLAEQFSLYGGTHLFIDEVHKYPNWSIEMKNVYDNFPELKTVFTGSSILEIYKSDADLSRRAVKYELHGLSFREYLALENHIDLPALTLQEIIENHIDIADSIRNKIKIIPLFKNYLKYGYYPIYKEGVKNYFSKLENIINTTLERDLPSIEKIDYQGIYNVKKLLMLLAALVPYTPNIEKLSAEMQLNRASTLKYLHYLNKAALTHQLLVPNKGMSLLTKPEKVYLNNPNLVYALGAEMVNTGNIRETFFFNQLNVKHSVNLPKKGDFLIDNTYIFEVGGKNKKFEQIKDLENSFIAADDIEIGAGNTIPLWLFGLLY